MSVYDEINARVNAAAQKAHENENVMSKEEATKLFFADMTDLFNETVAGVVTLADGRTADIKKIPTIEL